MLLMPLYFQSVRGESAMSAGLLLAPRARRDASRCRLAGQLGRPDGHRPHRPRGLVLIGASFVGLTQLGAETSYWPIGALLFVIGLGIGFTMMPSARRAADAAPRAIARPARR